MACCCMVIEQNLWAWSMDLKSNSFTLYITLSIILYKILFETALKNYAQDALVSKKLIQLNCDIPLENNLEAFKKPNLLTNKLKDFLLAYGFKSLVAKIFSQVVLPTNADLKQAEIPVSTVEQVTLVDMNQKLKSTKTRKIAIHDQEDKIFIYTSEGEYFALNNEEKASLFHQLIKLDFKIFLYDSKKIIKELNWDTSNTLNNMVDISLISFTLNTEGKRSLKDLANVYLSIELNESAQEQVQIIYELGEVVIEKLHQEGLEKIYYDIDLPML